MSHLVLGGMNAVVIGGSSGIGNAIAAGLQRAGASVVIIGRNPEKLDRATAELQKEDPQASSYRVDVTNTEQFQETAKRIEEKFGGIDILVNSQGITEIKPALDVTEADFTAVLTTNLTSVFTACTHFGRGMIARGSGSIINIASLAAHRGWSKAVAYTASKHGVAGITMTLAAEWAPHGVRVNAISPGYFLTDLNRERMSSERKENALKRTPMGRFGELPELAQIAVYLASPQASFVTGAIINVDGGYLASGI